MQTNNKFQIAASAAASIATVNLLSGTDSIANDGTITTVGDNDQNGTLNVAGATVTMTGGGSGVVVGVTSASTGNISVTSGSLTIGSSGDTTKFSIGGYSSFGGPNASNGIVTVQGSGTLTVTNNGGSLIIGNQTAGQTGIATGTININTGGTFASARNLTLGTANATDSRAIINFNGGTLQALAGITMQGLTTATVYGARRRRSTLRPIASRSAKRC